MLQAWDSFSIILTPSSWSSLNPKPWCLLINSVKIYFKSIHFFSYLSLHFSVSNQFWLFPQLTFLINSINFHIVITVMFLKHNLIISFLCLKSFSGVPSIWNKFYNPIEAYKAHDAPTSNRIKVISPFSSFSPISPWLPLVSHTDLFISYIQPQGLWTCSY